jgi:hypothetical protein
MAPVQGADSQNLLVMIEDSDSRSVSRHNPINQRVHASISEQLNHIVDVYDETSLTLGKFKQGRVRRTDGELIDIARSINRPPIDLIAVFSTYAVLNTTPYSKKVRARVQGRLLNAQSGKFIDNFEVQSPSTWTISYDCVSEKCIFEEMGDEAKILGDEIGLILAEKLAWQLYGDNSKKSQGNDPVSPQIISDYYLEFNGFSADELANIEEYILVFSGYRSHRPTQKRYARTTWLYRSTIGSAKLSRNIQKLLEELNIRATLHFVGNQFSLKRITLRGEQANPDISQGW